ncbi:MAG: Crp/Fnr family transcriptional regulator [Chloroflexota bacterium]
MPTRDSTDNLSPTRLAPHLWDQLTSLAQTRVYRPGEAVFSQGDPPAALYLVLSGRVKVVRVTVQGYEHILCVRGPGEHFCPVALLDHGPQLGTALAMTDVRLLRLEQQAFADLCRESPELLSAVQGDCLAEVRRLLHRLEAVAFRSVRQRVAHALLSLSRQGAPSPTDTLHLTQQELGGLIGASRESVSRTLTDLERLEAVSVSRARVRITDRRLLERAAATDRPQDLM